MRPALWLIPLAVVGVGLGYTLRPVLAPSGDGARGGAQVGDGGSAAEAEEATPLLLRSPSAPAPAALPLAPVRPVDERDDPAAIVPRSIQLSDPDAASATTFTAQRLATRVLERLLAANDEVTLRSCLERSHERLPREIRIEIGVSATRDEVTLRGVRLIEPDQTAADEACIGARLPAGMKEPRHESLAPLLERDGVMVETLALPAN